MNGARMSRADWLDAVLAILGVTADKLTGPDRAFLTMSRSQLVAVEFALVAMRDSGCQVGCGDCDWCSTQNRAAQEAYDRANPVIGKMVRVMPMTAESKKWVAINTNRKTNAVKMVKRVAERFTVRAPNGKQRTFGPHDACWSVLP